MNLSITFRGCYVSMPNLNASSFVTLGICWNQIWFTNEQLELSRESCARLARVWQYDCRAGRIEIVTFTIKCEVLNVKTEVKSFKSVDQASHDTGPSEFKERRRFYGSYVYSAWRPSSCLYNTQAQCQQYSLTITRINRILRHCLEKKRSELLCPMSTNR